MDVQQNESSPEGYAKHRFIMEEAEKRLVEASQEVARLCGSREWQIRVSTIGSDIGNAMQEKWDDASKKMAKPFEGDDSCLLESAYQVIGREIQDRDNPPFSRACALIVDMLRSLHDMEESARAMRLPMRSETYFNLHVAPVVTSGRCYVFLLYVTYLRLHLDNQAPAIRELDELLDRYRLFAILSSYPAGVTDLFVAKNGRHLFEERGGRPFENRYHYNRAIQRGETILSLVQLYPNWDRTTADRIQSLRDHNPALEDVGPEAELLGMEPPVTTVRMVPPAKQMKGYDERVKEFGERIRSVGSAPVEQVSVSQPAEGARNSGRDRARNGTSRAAEPEVLFTLEEVRERLIKERVKEDITIDHLRRQVSDHKKEWGIKLYPRTKTRLQSISEDGYRKLVYGLVSTARKAVAEDVVQTDGPKQWPKCSYCGKPTMPNTRCVRCQTLAPPKLTGGTRRTGM